LSQASLWTGVGASKLESNHAWVAGEKVVETLIAFELSCEQARGGPRIEPVSFFLCLFEAMVDSPETDGSLAAPGLVRSSRPPMAQRTAS
jgi:hypothetical protein